MIGKGADRLNAFATKFNNIGKSLSENDLGGAVKGAFGVGSGVRPDGTPFNHLGEVNKALKDMNTRLAELKGAIAKGEFEGDALKAAESLNDRTNEQRNAIQGVVDSAKQAAREVE